MLKRFDKFINFLYYFALGISVSTLVAIVLMNAGNLLLRWSVKRPIEWALEVSLILFVYSVMFIVPVVYRDKNLIQMHLIDEILGKGGAKHLNLIVDVVVLAFLVYLLPISIRMSADQIEMLSRGLGIPRTYVTLPVPIGVALTLPICVSSILHQIQGLLGKGERPLKSGE